LKITRIRLFQAPLPLKDGPWRWGKGFEMAAGVAHVVALDTDQGLTGWGETAPMVSFYLPAFDQGIPAGIEALAPHLLGLDPTRPAAVDAEMDRWLLGHPYVKAPIDMACWDLAGKALGAPCHALLGGRRAARMTVFRSIVQMSVAETAETLARYRAEGFRHFQLKIGGDPDEQVARVRETAALLRPGEKLLADANRGWRRDEALRFVHGVRGVPFTLEQPCDAYDDCLAVRRRCDQPMKLDESIKTLDDLLRALADDACDMVCLKIAKQGGLTKTRLLRDICAARGMPMTVEDVWGGEIVSAAVAHLAASTPPEVMSNTTDHYAVNAITLADGRPEVIDGDLTVSDRPGLGVTPRMDVLGDPVAVFA
jgi:L-alanine-DL-glutamate epimerase-like enolase superfamily enzyme